jgi:hypothetical protein
MADLDTLVERARTATVRAGPADAYVREVERWAAPAPKRWLPWLVTAATAAAAVIAIALWPHDTQRIEIAVRPVHVDLPATPPIAIGDRVAIVVEPGTAFRVIRAAGDETRIAVDHGVVTARLFHGAPHRLTLEGGGIVATATGTIYSLAVRPGGATVHVDQGTVSVRDTAGTHDVPAASQPSQAANALLALPPPPVPEPPPVKPAPTHSAPPPAPPQESLNDRWHRARLFRSQGKLAEAIAECTAIADTNDATWAPIALVEAARIYLGPLGDPEHAIATADRMIAAWPTASLAGEAREIRCRALTQLGRGVECDRTTGDTGVRSR